MTQSQTLERLVSAGRSVSWESREVASTWSKLDHAVRSGRKALPVAVTPLAFGLFPLIAKAGVLALAVGTSTGATVWIYRATESPVTPTSDATTTVLAVAGATADAPRTRRAKHGNEEEEPHETTALRAPLDEAAHAELLQSPLAATAGSIGLVEVDPLKQELSLLRRAKRRLDQGDFFGSRSDLKEHARRFPSGIVANERRALQHIVDCSLSRGALVRSRANRFMTSHPRSIHRAAVARACGIAVKPSSVAPAPSSSESRDTQNFEATPQATTPTQPPMARQSSAAIPASTPMQAPASATAQGLRRPAPAAVGPTNGPPTASFPTD